MLVDLVEDHLTDATPPAPALGRAARPSGRWGRIVIGMAALALATGGYAAGRIDARADDPLAEPAPAPVTTPPADWIETSQGLSVALDDPVLASPVTEGATTLREAAELWAADLTAGLTAEEVALMQDHDETELTYTIDAATGRVTSVQSGAGK
jgi:hypothetical protein